MKSTKVHIQKNTVQETLMIPLYARKVCSELFPTLFQDHRAAELVSRLDYDFDRLTAQYNGTMQRFGALEIAMRQTDLATEVRQYLQEHPRAAVVNLGCGLDQTGENCDNGTCKIYNLDLPDVIAVRNMLLPSTDRIRNLAVDLNDTAWFGLIDASEGVVFFAAGVFYYFTQQQIQKLFNKMALEFPGGRLVFDTAGKLALKMMLKTWVKQAGITNVGAYFYVENIETHIRPWLENAEVFSKGYMLGYQDLKVPQVSGFFRWLAKIGDSKMHMQIVRIEFDG